MNFQLFGMSRSGHHPILYWIGSHFGNVWHYNNCQFSALPGYMATPVPGVYHNNEITQIRQQPGPACAIFSFEEQLTPIPLAARHVLCLRDPYNLFASRTKKQRALDGRALIFFSDVLLWKLFAREYLRPAILSDVLKVNYNAWFSDREYRCKVATEFAPKTNDDMLNFVPHYWEGSSFDGLQYQGRAQEMAVLDRWKEFADDQEFIQKVMRDREVYELSKEIFGPII